MSLTIAPYRAGTFSAGPQHYPHSKSPEINPEQPAAAHAHATLVQQLEALNELIKKLVERATPTVAPSENAQRYLSSVAPGVKPRDIWRGFWQGSQGNCVTVSAIKAAMAKYGHNPHGIYKHIKQTQDGFDVTMRDSRKLHVSFDELTQAANGSDFEGDDSEVKKDAIFLYAVSAKRAQLENNQGTAKHSFQHAMDSLNDGEFPGDALKRLGLYAHRRWASPAQLEKGTIGTVADAQHSVAVIDGYADVYGNKVKLSESGYQRARQVLILV